MLGGGTLSAMRLVLIVGGLVAGVRAQPFCNDALLAVSAQLQAVVRLNSTKLQAWLFSSRLGCTAARTLR